jgi:hypothetical protein
MREGLAIGRVGTRGAVAGSVATLMAAAADAAHGGAPETPRRQASGLQALRGWCSARTAPRGVHCGRLYAGSQGAVMQCLDEAQRQAQAHLAGFGITHPTQFSCDVMLYPCDPKTPSRGAVMKHPRPQPHGAVCRFSLPDHEQAVS